MSVGKHSTPTPPQLPQKNDHKDDLKPTDGVRSKFNRQFFPALTDQQLVKAALPQFLPAEDRDADDVADDADDAHHAVGVPGKA